tara:strand:- start:9168 stop:9284 length:117 start_codon:yes stop_codon:yes gene_type:complete
LFLNKKGRSSIIVFLGLGLVAVPTDLIASSVSKAFEKK